MADIFISYSSKDHDLVKKLAVDIEAHGYSVWWDFKLIGGERFRHAILKELREAKVVLVIWTSNSIESQWVEEEADEASANHKLVPVIADDLSIRHVPIGFRGLQMCKFSNINEILFAIDTKISRTQGSAAAPGSTKAREEVSNENVEVAKPPPTLQEPSPPSAAAVSIEAKPPEAPSPKAPPLPPETGPRSADPSSGASTFLNRRVAIIGMSGVAAAAAAVPFITSRSTPRPEAIKIATTTETVPRAPQVAAEQPVPLETLVPVLTNATMLRAVAFSPSKPQLAVAGEDGGVRLIEWETFKISRTLRSSRRSAAAKSICYSSDGTRLACAFSDGRIEIWDLDNFSVAFDARSTQKKLFSIGYYPNRPDRYFAVGGTNAVEIWSIRGNRVEGTLKLHQGPVRAVAYAQDKHGTFATGGDDGQVVFYLPGNRQKSVYTKGKTALFSLSFSPDNTLLAGGAADGTIMVWDAGSQTLKREFEQSHAKHIFSLAFSADGRKLISGGADHVVRVWDVGTGSLLKALEGHQGHVEGVVFSTLSRFAVSVSEDKTLRLWDVDADKEVLRGVYFSDDEFAAYSSFGPYTASSGAEQHLTLAMGGAVGPVSGQFRGRFFSEEGLAKMLESPR